MPAKFNILGAKDGSLYFVMKAANGEVVLTSQMYKSKRNAKKGIASVQTNGPDAERFGRLKDKRGKHYFVLKAANNQVIGTSQKYTTPAAMEKAIKSTVRTAEKAVTRDEA